MVNGRAADCGRRQAKSVAWQTQSDRSGLFPLWRKCTGRAGRTDNGFPLKCCDPVCSTVYVYAHYFFRNAHCPLQDRPSVEGVNASLPECRHFSPFARALTKGNQKGVLLGKTQGRGGGRPERDVADGHVLAKGAAVWCSIRPPVADRPLPVGDLGHQGCIFHPVGGLSRLCAPVPGHTARCADPHRRG